MYVYNNVFYICVQKCVSVNVCMYVEYRKMVVHFCVNEITFAEKSVDLRMQREMLLGAQAVAAEGSSAR
jgi:hypothetical protein